MKLILKVSDLLMESWKTDTIKIQNYKTDLLPNTTKDWINWEIFLQSLDSKTILCILKNFSANMEFISDLSLKNFEKKIECPDYQVRFLLDFDKNSENAFDSEFPIDPKNITIDLEEIVYQCIKLQEPPVLLAEWETLDKFEDEEYNNYA